MKSKKQFRQFSLFLISIAFLFVYGCNSNDPNNPSTTTVKDIDGNVYHTIKIGTQLWMVENLKTTKYNNGEPIKKITVSNDSASVGEYCNYNNDETLGNKYGRLYNCRAVLTGKLAPIGWHIPTPAEWTTLINYVSGNIGTSGSVVKALASATDWVLSTNTSAAGFNLTTNNSTGFNALPGGLMSGDFRGIGKECMLYSSDIQEVTYNGNKYLMPIGLYILYSSGELWIDKLEVGFYNSVRCIKDN